MKYVLRFLLPLPFLFAFLYFAGPTVFKGWIQKKALSEMESAVDAFVNFSSLEVSTIKKFPNIHVHLQDFLIMGEHTFAGDTLIAAQSIELTWNPWKEAPQTLIENLEIENGLIQLVYDKYGEANFDIAKKEESDSSNRVDSTQVDSVPPAPFSIEVAQYEFKNIACGIEDQTWDMFMRVQIPSHQGQAFMSQDSFRLSTQNQAKDIFLSIDDKIYINHMPVEGDLTMYAGQSSPDVYFMQTDSLRFDAKFYGLSGLIGYRFEEDLYEVDINYSLNEVDIPGFRNRFPHLYKQVFGKDERMDGQLGLVGQAKGLYDSTYVPALYAYAKLRDWQPPSIPTFGAKVQLDVEVKGPENDWENMDLLLIRPKNRKKLNLFLFKRYFDQLKDIWIKTNKAPSDHSAGPSKPKSKIFPPVLIPFRGGN
ncbi:MAG: hypothetical protein AAFY71_13140 [Bacteroidota bacterium]